MRYGVIDENIFTSLIGQPTNYTGLTQCQQDNNPVTNNLATPTSTTTPTSTNTPTVTQTVTTTS